jgi:adenosylhomocysteine nucleosidase
MFHHSKMSTLICFALREEAAPFRKIAAAKSGITILLTGIGRQNAEKSLREFLGSAPAPGAAVDASSTAANDAASFATREGARAPQLVLTCGFAGGLNPDLKLGEVVFEIPSSSSRRESAQTETGNQPEPIYIGCYDKLIAAGAKPAKIFCADRIATTVAEKKKLRAETGADAVEMESAAIHAVCRERGIPCATVRVISDTASEDLPLDFNALSKPDKNLDFGKLFLAIAKSPGKIPALMQLQKRTKFAAEKLAEVLAQTTFP